MLIMQFDEKPAAFGDKPEPTTRRLQPSPIANRIKRTTSSSVSGSYTRLHDIIGCENAYSVQAPSTGRTGEQIFNVIGAHCAHSSKEGFALHKPNAKMRQTARPSW
jgi:hypothetical protein